jgi:hypothetical protein
LRHDAGSVTARPVAVLLARPNPALLRCVLRHGRVGVAISLFSRSDSTTSSFIVAVGGVYGITEIASRNYLLGIAWNWLIIPTMDFLTYMFWVFRESGRKGRTA